MRRVGLLVVDISTSSTSELGTIISTASSSESEDAFSFLVERDFGCLVGEEGVRDFEGPATPLPNNIGSPIGVHSGLLFRFLGVPWSTRWARRFKSCKTNGLFGTRILAERFRPLHECTYLAVFQADTVSSTTGLVLRWHSLVAFRQFGHSGLTASGGRIH